MNEQGTRFLDAIAAGPLVMDAAMGTRLMSRGLDLNDRSDGSALWNLTHPDVVAEIHALDVAAGADVLLTNTFLASRIWLEPRGYGNRVTAINRRAAAMAREAAGPDRFVLGSIGPTAAHEGSLGDYAEQAEALADAGVDGLLFETHFYGQAHVALSTVRGLVTIPLFVSSHGWTISRVPHLLGMIDNMGIFGIGVNCVRGMDAAVKWAAMLGTVTRLPILIKPSGTTNNRIRRDDNPASFARAVPALVASGARLIGGCCGTTEAHVAALRGACYDPAIRMQAGRQPRRA